MKTATKAQVIKYIKDHGEEGAFEWRATINGVKVRLCKSTITLYDEGYKFPAFHKVSLNENGTLMEFETNKGHGAVHYNIFDGDMRTYSEIADKYFKVMEGILNNA